MEDMIKTQTGLNKTGIMMSPIDSKEAIEGAQDYTHPPDGEVTGYAENRISYINEADPIGTVPMPMNVKGFVASAQSKLLTGSPAFLDMLGERIGFERTGVRLYDALLVKYEATEDKKNLPPLELLEQFQREELNHFHLLAKVMTELGGDPTSVTPAANICSVASLGWVKIVTDPRTNFTQTLEIILQAELVDNDGWQILINLADAVGLKDISEQFKKAQEEEVVHLLHVRQWMKDLLTSGKVSKKTLTH